MTATSTFLVTTVTPGQLRDHANTGIDRALRAALPFSVTVATEPRTDYAGVCGCREVYRLTDDSVRWLKKRGMFRAALIGERNPCICPCMGRPI